MKLKKAKTPKKAPRIAVFIDAGNLWGVYKSIGKMLDLSKLDEFFCNKFNGKIFKIFYFVAFPPVGTRSISKIDKFHKFLIFLKKGLNFEVIKKPLKTIYLRDNEGNLIFDQDTGKQQSIEKGNLDIELTIEAIKYSSAYDIAILVTGDSDFLPLISYLKNLKKAKKVFIFSTEGRISQELKTGGDGYFDIRNFPQIHGGNLHNEGQ